MPEEQRTRAFRQNVFYLDHLLILMACIFCGSRSHDYRSCTLLYKKKGARVEFKKDYFGKSPNVFVGRHGYPNVRVGLLGTENYEGNDEPLQWSEKGTPIDEIVDLRAALVNGHVLARVKGDSGAVGLARDVSLAKRPVDVEVNLVKKPRARLNTGKDVLPHGPSVGLQKAAIAGNIPIDSRVDKAVSAEDLNATDAVNRLLKRGVDSYHLTKVFSMGNLGIPAERKLVPTRWSITAVDDIAGKEFIAKIRQLPHSDCMAYFGGHHGNYYLILFFDDAWQYELFEQYLPSGEGKPQAWTDHEPYSGRKVYAKETAGGYYAARLPIAEHLYRKRRQSSVLAIRIITDEYTVPLGVWVVREAVRKALSAQPVRFGDRQLMLRHAKAFLARRFAFDIEPLLKRSSSFPTIFCQKKLTSY